MVIAEGVETEDDVHRLQQLNCKYAQGFYFSEAVTGAELQRRLAAQTPRPAPMKKPVAEPAPQTEPSGAASLGTEGRARNA